MAGGRSAELINRGQVHQVVKDISKGTTSRAVATRVPMQPQQRPQATCLRSILHWCARAVAALAIDAIAITAASAAAPAPASFALATIALFTTFEPRLPKRLHRPDLQRLGPPPLAAKALDDLLDGRPQPRTPLTLGSRDGWWHGAANQLVADTHLEREPSGQAVAPSPAPAKTRCPREGVTQPDKGLTHIGACLCAVDGMAEPGHLHDGIDSLAGGGEQEGRIGGRWRKAPPAVCACACVGRCVHHLPEKRVARRPKREQCAANLKRPPQLLAPVHQQPPRRWRMA